MIPDAHPGPALVVHGAGHVSAALSAAAAAGRSRMLLVSSPDAACFMGAAWWRALVAAAEDAEIPPAVDSLLDCGSAAGRAMEAMRLGQRRIILHPACPQFSAVLGRAAGHGVRVEQGRPPALDLADPGAGRRLDAWLRLG